MSEDRSDPGVRSVQLALDILETVAFSSEALGVTQLANRLNVAKGSVHRHLLTLVDRGYLAQNPANARYAIGPKSRLLARLAPDLDLTRVAQAPMIELRDELGHTVVLSSMTPRGALVLATLANIAPVEIGVRPGSELSFHASAQGKVLLAFAPRALQERILSRPRPTFTTKTIIGAAEVENELLRIREADTLRHRNRLYSASMLLPPQSSTRRIAALARSPSLDRFSSFRKCRRRTPFWLSSIPVNRSPASWATGRLLLPRLRRVIAVIPGSRLADAHGAPRRQ